MNIRAKSAVAVLAFSFGSAAAALAVGDVRKSPRPTEWPVVLAAARSSAGAANWNYSVKLKITNTLDRVLMLDEPSIAYGGRPGAAGTLSSNLFDVTSDGGKILYRGMMKDRLPADTFFQLPPGKSYEVIVELGEGYPVSKGSHDVVVRFESPNHFSPDNFLMKSEPIKIRLGNKK